MPHFRKYPVQSDVPSAILHRKIFRKISFYFDHWKVDQSVYPIIFKSSIHMTPFLNERFAYVLPSTLYMIIGKFVLFTETSCSYSVPLAQSYCNRIVFFENDYILRYLFQTYNGCCIPLSFVCYKKTDLPKKYKK